MSIAYPVAMVQVLESVNMNGLGVAVGSRWVSGNLLFRCGLSGRQIRDSVASWAMAEDSHGRLFVIWHSENHGAGGLVIQKADSEYCYEVERLEA